MIQTTAQPSPEGRLRRWWRGFYATLQAMEASGYERLDDRIGSLDARVRKLEALQAQTKAK